MIGWRPVPAAAAIVVVVATARLPCLLPRRLAANRWRFIYEAGTSAAVGTLRKIDASSAVTCVAAAAAA